MKLKFFLVGLFLSFSLFLTNAFALFYDASGHNAQLSNKWVIINYWADWCDSCLSEVSELNHFYSHNHDKNVVFYGVNYDQLPIDGLKIAIKNAGISFPVLQLDPNSLWDLGQIDVIPTTFFINPNGQMVKKIVGPSTEKVIAKTLHELELQA